MAHTQTTVDDREPDPRIVRCERVVDALTEVGMALVRSLHPDRGPPPAGDPFLAYCRVSRALRLILLLDQRLHELAADGAHALAAAPPSALIGSDVAAVEASESPEPAEQIERAETARPRADRESPDEALRYLDRPLDELVAAICRDLGLSPEATAEALAPFAELAANDDGAGEGVLRRCPQPASTPTPSPSGSPDRRRDRALGP